MLDLLFGADGETLRTFSTVLDEISIGTDPQCHLELSASDVAPVHCWLQRDARGQWFASPQAAIAINGREVTEPTYVGPADKLQIGPITLYVKPARVDPGEHALLEGARHDLAARAVYADWLEERGEWDRAEFLRLTVAAAELTPDDPRFAATTTRIQKLARCLDPKWRLQLAASAVEGCRELRREFVCNLTWDRLTPTDDPQVRTCGVCRSEVRYCTTELEATARAERGECIVIDVGVDHFAADTARRSLARAGRPQPVVPVSPAPPGMYLPPSFVQLPERPCAQCAATVPAGYRWCSQCGAQT